MTNKTQEAENVDEVRRTIDTLPPDQREKCLELAQHIAEVIKRSGTIGVLAIALVGVQMQLIASESERDRAG
jgi:hypothetical protein